MVVFGSHLITRQTILRLHNRCELRSRVSIRTFFRFAIKVGIAGGTVYYLSSVGVWKESAESTKIYGKLNTVLGPHIQDLRKQLPIEVSL